MVTEATDTEGTGVILVTPVMEVTVTMARDLLMPSLKQSLGLLVTTRMEMDMLQGMESTTVDCMGTTLERDLPTPNQKPNQSPILGIMVDTDMVWAMGDMDQVMVAMVVIIMENNSNKSFLLMK